jgi:hypothetical protein
MPVQFFQASEYDVAPAASELHTAHSLDRVRDSISLSELHREFWHQ